MQNQKHYCLHCIKNPRESCIDLKGTLAIHNIFVDCLPNHWDEKEINAVERALRECCAWIKREASKYSITVDTRISENHFIAKSDRLPPSARNSRDEIFEWSSNVLKSIDFEDMQHYAHTFQEEEKAENWITFFHVQVAGRSYAFDSTAITPIEFLVCFSEYADTPERKTLHTIRPDPREYAHEILHLFGAKDKYETSDKHPLTDIMNRLDKFSLELLSISKPTAQEIRWIT